MAQKRRRTSSSSSVEFVREVNHPLQPPTSTTRLASSCQQPAWMPTRASTSSIPDYPAATINGYDTTVQHRNHSAPSTTARQPPPTQPPKQQPQPTFSNLNTEFTDALNTALSALSALRTPPSSPTPSNVDSAPPSSITTPSTGTAFHPLAFHLLTHNHTTPQLTLTHYHRTTNPLFTTHLSLAITSLQRQSSSSYSALTRTKHEVMASRREQERRMHRAVWEGWIAENEMRRKEWEEERRRMEVRREAERKGREAVRRARERWERENRA